MNSSPLFPGVGSNTSADESGEFAQSVIDTVREPLIILDQDLKVVTGNRSFYDVFMVNPEETVGRLIYNLGNKQWNIPKLRDLLETILPLKTSFDNYEVEHEFAGIGRRIMLLNARQIKRALGKERIILLAFEDITERKQTQDTLYASELRYRRLFESAKDGILILDAETGMIVDVNPFLVHMLDYSHEQFIGKAIWDIGFFKDLVANEDKFRQLQQNEYVRYEHLPLKTADGRQIDVEFVSNVYLVNGAKVIQCNIRDITERKRAEVLLQQRNDELMRFTYTVSHDLKSPLVTIMTFLGYLEKDIRVPDTARVEKDFGYIRNAADKMTRLLAELLELSRVGRKISPPVDVPLQVVVQEALDIVAGQISSRGVRVTVTTVPAVLHGDRPRLVEIFQNLVDNAVKFMGDQADPLVEIGVETVNGQTVFFVRDNGMGIDPRHQAKLFGLFEKLNPASEGSGMGLALVKRIVEVHDGRIWVESEGEGKGTTFRFTLDKGG